tara:strand:- start:114 stop:422 length:309 start_codon:yes stop_codon:yes gene_type:complete
MKSRDKQNKQKLKFDYIANLQNLGKIWKEHCRLVDSTILRTDNNYPNEVIKSMSKSKRQEYCLIINKCNDIASNISNIDSSLTKSHKMFLNYKKIILKLNQS